MANRKKRGRSKGGEVAAPTKQVTTSVDAGGVPLTDAEPPTKIGGRSKGKVGSENEPVETAPGDEELNISEDGVTVATATTIFQEVTNSTEVGGVPTTDPPMSEVPNNDEGGVKTRTDATEPSNTTALKQLQTTPDNELSKLTEEKLLSVCDYAYPFTIYQRCVPGNDWVTDAPISTPCDIFPVTGSRRKNEVRDNFDWLLPRTNRLMSKKQRRRIHHITNLVLALALQTKWFQTKYVPCLKVSRTGVLVSLRFINVS